MSTVGIGKRICQDSLGRLGIGMGTMPNLYYLSFFISFSTIITSDHLIVLRRAGSL